MADVGIKEVTGSEIIIEGKKVNSYVARVKVDKQVAVDEKLLICFNMQNARFFDKDTDAVIT